LYGDYFVGRHRQRDSINVIVAEGQHADAVHDTLLYRRTPSACTPARLC
jgi:hypothetical protein